MTQSAVSGKTQSIGRECVAEWRWFSRALKMGGIGLAALIVITVSALSIADWNQYRGDVADIIANRTGLRMDVDDNLTLRLFPKPALSAGRVRLSTDNDGQQLTIATIDRLDMVVDLPALLTGEIAIRDVVAAGMKTGLYQGADGQWRLEGLLQQNTAAGNNISFGVDKLDISNSEIRLQSFGEDEARLLRINDLSVSGRLFEAQTDIAGQFFLDRDGFEISARLQPGLTAGSQSFRFELNYPSGLVRASGRFGGDRPAAARLQVDGSSAHAFVSMVKRVLTASADIPEAGDGPVKLDASIEETAKGFDVLARQVQYGRSTGRLNASLLRPIQPIDLSPSVAAGRTANAHLWQLQNTKVQFAVLDAAPIVSWLIAPNDQATQAELSLPVSGRLNLEVEALDVRGGLMQQLAADIDLTATEARISGLTALLPGASALALDGLLKWGASDGGFEGTGTFSTVRLPEIANWLGLPISDLVPDGRLATARLSGDLSIDRGSWALENFIGEVDSSKLSGRISGLFGELVPRSIDVRADRVNINAYGLGDMRTNWCLLPRCIGIDSLPAGFDGDWQVGVADMQLADRAYRDIDLAVTLTPDDIRLQRLSLGDQSGSLSASGALVGVGESWQLEANVQLSAFGAKPILGWAGTSPEMIAAVNAGPLTGRFSLSGPITRLDMSAALEASIPDTSINIAGIAHLSVNGVELDAFQGSAAHPDVRPVLRHLTGLSARQPLPAQMNISLRGAADNASKQISISGDFADIRLAANLAHASETAVHDLRVDFAKASDWERYFDVALPGAVPNLPLRIAMVVRGDLRDSDTERLFEQIDVSNGDARLSGELRHRGDHSWSGRLLVSNLDADPALLSALAHETRGFTQARIDFELSGVRVASQRLAAPAASFVTNEGDWQFTVGEGATMNGRAVSLSLQTQQGQNERARILLTLDRASVDVGPLLDAAQVAAAMEGIVDVAGQISFADLSADGWRDSLSGRLDVQNIKGVLQGADFAALRDVQTQPESAQQLVRDIGLALGVPNADTSSQARERLQSKITSGTIELGAINGVVLVNSAQMVGDWGELTLDGRVLWPSDSLSLQGVLQIPVDEEELDIAVTLDGALVSPLVSFETDTYQKLALGRLQRRLRQRIFANLQAADNGTAGASSAPLEPGSLFYQLAQPSLAALAAAQQASAVENIQASDLDTLALPIAPPTKSAPK